MKIAAQSRAYRVEYATGEPSTIPIRSGSRTHGPLQDGFQATAAAAMRREQKIVAPMRQQSLLSRCWPQHGARDRSTPRQSEEAAATRRHPLAATLSCPRPPNLRRPVRFDSPRSVTSEIRVRASGSAYLDHILTAYRACSVRVASNPTRDGWSVLSCAVLQTDVPAIRLPNTLRDQHRSWTAAQRRFA